MMSDSTQPPVVHHPAPQCVGNDTLSQNDIDNDAQKSYNKTPPPPRLTNEQRAALIQEIMKSNNHSTSHEYIHNNTHDTNYSIRNPIKYNNQQTQKAGETLRILSANENNKRNMSAYTDTKLHGSSEGMTDVLPQQHLQCTSAVTVGDNKSPDCLKQTLTSGFIDNLIEIEHPPIVERSHDLCSHTKQQKQQEGKNEYSPIEEQQSNPPEIRRENLSHALFSNVKQKEISTNCSASVIVEERMHKQQSNPMEKKLTHALFSNDKQTEEDSKASGSSPNILVENRFHDNQQPSPTQKRLSHALFSYGKQIEESKDSTGSTSMIVEGRKTHNELPNLTQKTLSHTLLSNVKQTEGNEQEEESKESTNGVGLMAEGRKMHNQHPMTTQQPLQPTVMYTQQNQHQNQMNHELTTSAGSSAQPNHHASVANYPKVQGFNHSIPPHPSYHSTYPPTNPFIFNKKNMMSHSLPQITGIPTVHKPAQRNNFPILQQYTSDNNLSCSKECCHHNLNPAEIPRDPLDDLWDSSTLLEKEVAWLLEECEILLPIPATNDKSDSTMDIEKNKLLLSYAWKHGSLNLRQQMWEKVPAKVIMLVKKLNSDGIQHENNVTDMTFVDGCGLLLTNHDNENLIRLRKEARQALQLGFRRSESIERELNAAYGFKWRNAVEEVGEPTACNDEAHVPIGFFKQSRHRRQMRKRSANDALLQTALAQDDASKNGSLDVAAAAAQIPEWLTPLEDEIAWLVEESLILLPPDMLDGNKQSEVQISAGLVTNSIDSGIDWEYVVNNASDKLREELKRIGGINKRRPLQRIIRYHQTEVRLAFQNRRDDIASLLLLRGYRREKTQHSLPDAKLLEQTGLQKVWAVRLMRRRQNEVNEEVVSTKDLNSACKERIGDKPKSPKQTKRKRTQSPKKQRPPKVVVPKLTATQVATSYLLTAEEEEIAWLREEYEHEHGLKLYDWDYIEENSSLPLLMALAERQCAPSEFLSIESQSRLHAMVRFHDPDVETAFEKKRVDIRYAITQCGFRRDRTKHLPNISSAPESVQRPVAARGSSVVDIENGICVNGMTKNQITKAKFNWKRLTCLKDIFGCEDGDAVPNTGADNHSERNNQPVRNLKRKSTWRCDVCLIAVFDDYDEAVAHENECTVSKTTPSKATPSKDKQQGGHSKSIDQDVKKEETPEKIIFLPQTPVDYPGHDLKPNNIECSHCGRTGHTEKYCWNKEENKHKKSSNCTPKNNDTFAPCIDVKKEETPPNKSDTEKNDNKSIQRNDNQDNEENISGRSESNEDSLSEDDEESEAAEEEDEEYQLSSDAESEDDYDSSD